MNQGYYVMGTHQSVAWFISYLDAKEWVKQNKYRGGPSYTIVPVCPKVGATDEVPQNANL